MNANPKGRRGPLRGAEGAARLPALIALLLASVVFGAGVRRYFFSVGNEHRSVGGEHPTSAVRSASSQRLELDPGELSSLDPAVATAIREQWDKVKRRPDDAGALGRLGVLYEAHAFKELARRCYAAAVEADPSVPRWRFHWAVLLHEAGALEAAEREIRVLIAQQPDCAPAHERLGLWLLERNACDEAAASFQRVIALRPAEAPGYVGLARARLDHVDQALLAQRSAVQKAPPPVDAGIREAIELLHRALTIDPASKQAHYTLGRAYQLAGRDEEARREFSRGMHATTEFVHNRWLAEVRSRAAGRTATLSKADGLIRSGHIAEAVSALEPLLAADPADVDVANSLGLAYVSLGKPGEAKRVLQRALQGGRESYKTHAHLGVALLELGELEPALAQADTAVRLAPTKEWVHFLRGKILSKQGRTAEALDSFREAVRLDSPNPEVYVRMGYALIQLGRVEEAVEPLKNAVALAPKSGQTRYNLAMVYARLGRFDEALEELRAAQRLDPTDDRVRRALAGIERVRSERDSP